MRHLLRQSLVPIGAVMLAMTAMSASAATGDQRAYKTQPAYKTDAVAIRYLPRQQYLQIVAEWEQQPAASRSIIVLVKNVRVTSSVYEPRGRGLRSALFTRRKVYTVVMDCEGLSDEFYYYLRPNEFDNQSDTSHNYSPSEFMCRRS